MKNYIIKQTLNNRGVESVIYIGKNGYIHFLNELNTLELYKNKKSAINLMEHFKKIASKETTKKYTFQLLEL